MRTIVPNHHATVEGVIGQSVGSYVIQSPLGQGGMGMVYLAQHALLGRPAAIKVLLPEYSRDTEVVNRFFNEARAATTVKHPGIVEIYDFGYTPDGCAYIAMELLQGQSLAARIATGKMQPLDALSIARQIAGALGAAHGKGIVHRDLKPDNVFLVRDPEVPSGERIKLLDFGIAKLAGDGIAGSKTRTGAVMGTPTYMAPEQCRGVAVTNRADIYALGCIVFEMLCGHAPFVGEGVGDVLAAHIHVPPPMPRSIVPELPPAIESLVMNLLVKDPEKRTPNAEALIAAIDQVSGGALRVGTAPMIDRSAAPTIMARNESTTLAGSAGVALSTIAPPPSKGRGLLIGLGAIAIVAAAIVVIATRGGSASESSTNAASGATTPTTGVTTATTAAGTGTTATASAPTAGAATTTSATGAGASTIATAGVPTTATAGTTTGTGTATSASTTGAATPNGTGTTTNGAAAIVTTITSVPPGADVILDGKSIGKTPLPYSHDPGAKLTVVLRRDGYRDATASITSKDTSVTLVRKPTTVTKPTGQSVNPF